MRLDFCSEKMLKGFKDNNEDTTALLDSYITLYNDCLSARPSGLHVGVHLCRGNFVCSRHFSEGGYDAIATKLFQDLKYLYFDSRITPREHTSLVAASCYPVITAAVSPAKVHGWRANGRPAAWERGSARRAASQAAMVFLLRS
jgi:hypothetical protein